MFVFVSELCQMQNTPW